MKSRFKMPMMAVILFFLIALSSISTFAAASTYKEIGTKPVKVYTKEYYLKAEDDNPAMNQYTLHIRFGGGDYYLIEEICGPAFTNGTDIIYVKNDKMSSNKRNCQSTIWRYNIARDKEKKIISGIDLNILGVFSNYLYYGRVSPDRGTALYCLNMATGKKASMVSNAGTISIASKRVLVRQFSSDVSNRPFYIFHLNGTKKLKIASAVDARIKGNLIYYIQGNFKDNLFQMKTCGLDGSGKKTVRKWGKTMPKLP